MRVYLTVAPSSVFWQKFEIGVYRVATIHLRMKVRTMVLFAFSVLLARIDFVVPRVVLLLFPSVTVGAPILILTPV